MSKTNETNVALALVASTIKDKIEKESKKAIPENSQFEGEVVVRIPFRLTKGEAYKVKPTVNLLSLAVLAKAAVYCGVTEAALEKALVEAGTEAMEKGEKVADQLSENDARVNTMIERIQANVMERLPLQPRNGTVTVKILTDDALPEIVKSEIKTVA